MDIQKGDFGQLLQPMLEALCTAHFVSLDLEFSGIANKSTSRGKKNDNLARKPTLQERYEEVKEAAERYQVLQIGLTIVHQDENRGTYIVRPFNMFLNPIIGEKIGLERTFSFQSGAVEFLLENGFRMDSLFREGVSYLSREEEAAALANEEIKADRSRVPDIHLHSKEVENLAFMNKAREDIRTWQELKPRPTCANIGVSGHTITQGTSRVLNNLQRRLIHQLVRAEFPDLVAVSRSGYMQIIPFDQEREDNIKKARMAAFHNKLQKQVGLRWFVEGLVGGPIGHLDPINFLQWVPGQPVWMDVNKAKEKFETLQSRISRHPTVLVGHNVFVDLVYFYQTFFGSLPDRIEEFSRIIHKLFPMVIDTKYVATHLNDDGNAKSGLNELDAELKPQKLPKIETCMGHSKYDDYCPSHEAGYDSLVTARVLIRLSAHLETLGSYIVESEDDYIEAEEASDPATLIENVKIRRSHDERRRNHVLNPLSPEIPLKPMHPVLESSSTTNKVKRQKQKSEGSSKSTGTTFSHPGMFDLLTDDLSDEDEGRESEESASDGDDAASENSSGGVTLSNASTHLPRPEYQGDGSNKKKPGVRLMPPWHSDFWNVYGNKLRVNGTEEGVCFLEGDR